MRGKLIQGEGSSASIFVKDESGVFVNPEIFPMIEVHLVEVLGYTTLAKYSNPSKVGYLPIEFDERLNPNTNQLVPFATIKFSEQETKDVPVGSIEAQIHLTVPDSTYPNGEKNTIYKGKLAKMIRSKRR